MAATERHRIEIAGTVQGVGFRPFVHKLANELGLNGWARNSLIGLSIEIEGDATACATFLQRVSRDAPGHAVVRGVSASPQEPRGDSDFMIRRSGEKQSGNASAEIVPDLATCSDCLREIFDPTNRRYHYPFTNCTQCGPRFSIVLSLPYDRERTTMRDFPMCAACREEYGSPIDRRFHAQPNACPDCGPQLSFTDAHGRVLASREEALERAAQAIEAGQIVAVKGIGGFHLIADARSSETVSQLRIRKHRPAKALAVMMLDLVSVRSHCELSSLEEKAIASPGAPIVLLRRRDSDTLPDSLAPGNPGLGVLLPYSPLHHLLMRRLAFPVIATSGNISDEPICTENDEAFLSMRGIADAFLVHDRSIARAVDDSVLRVTAGRELFLRRSRGFTPVTIEGNHPPVLATGGDQKTSIAVSGPFGIRCGQHIGDLETEPAQQVFAEQCLDFPSICQVQPQAVAADQHPGYHSVRMAEEMGLELIQVQHHHAHVASCLAEHHIEEEVLGIAWDGTGYGTDGTIWGGEFLIANQTDSERFASLRSFPLPGGELAIRQPRYAALGLLFEAGIAVKDTPLASAFTEKEIAIAYTQLEKRIRVASTSSAGRLFDAVAALTGLRWHNEFEAQAAMDMECMAGPDGSRFTPLELRDQILDWEPMIRALLEDLSHNVQVPTIVARFMESMSDAILLIARVAGKKTVVLTGGCFQNALLLERTIARLREEEFVPVWPNLMPPNDGGLALGQAIVAGRKLQSQSAHTHVPRDPRKSN
ncbi:MAG: carbamoyltransferase HypF [Verrucomicrobiales bacterium]|nr:carbamoyltransferase HypF [Verrucomicrobiales bacterium]